MKKIIAALATTLVLGAFATPALATSPHFIRASASVQGTNLVISFKEAGLGDNLNIDYTASAFAVRVDSCVNGGNHVPSDPKKTTTSAEVSSDATFSVKNGTVNGSFSLAAPASTLQCPPGQKVTLQSLDFSDIHLIDTTDNIEATFG